MDGVEFGRCQVEAAGVYLNKVYNWPMSGVEFGSCQVEAASGTSYQRR